MKKVANKWRARAARIMCALACAAALASCSGSASDKPVLAVSIEPQRKMLEELAGSDFSVVTVLAAGANPETYEPSMAQRRQLADAQAYFMLGYLPFEHSLEQAAGNARIVNASEGIEALTGTHEHAGHEHAHGDADPHVWTSLRNGKLMARNMTHALCELDPANAEAYRSRCAALEHRLDSLDSVAANTLVAANVHAFAVWHPSLSYYARDYGLHQVSVGQESKEAPVRQLRAVAAEAKADSVGVFFYQKEMDSRQAASLNSEIGSRLVEINPLAYEWEDELMRITYELARP